MTFSELDLKVAYNSGDDNLLVDFYKPIILRTNNYKRITGFFSSNFLNNLVEEIKEVQQKQNIYIQILCSPKMTEQDTKDIELGYNLREKMKEKINEVIDSFEDDANQLPFISELISSNILDIKFVFMKKTEGMFHDKKGIFIDIEGNKIAFTGSNNETQYGLTYNYESFVVIKDTDSRDHVDYIEKDFDTIWNNEKKGLETLDVSSEIQIIINKKIDDIKSEIQPVNKQFSLIKITNQYTLHNYQDKAVKNWLENGGIGLFEMATGTGKTVTALACSEKISDQTEKLITVIVVPQINLLKQWDEDIENAGAKSIKCYSENPRWEKELKINIKTLRREDYKHLTVIATRDTFTSNKFISIIEKIEFDSLLIADEVHSFASNNARKLYTRLKSTFTFRLGISATPYRREDSETRQLIGFFDKTVYKYSLKDAINDGWLNNYEYHPKFLYFDKEQLNRYHNNYAKNKDKIKRSDIDALREFDNLTSTILNSSTAKVQMLKNDLKDRDDDFQAIVYCSPGGYNDTIQIFKSPHIEFVAKEIGAIKGVKLRIIRSEVDSKEREKILNQFKNRELNVLIAIKILDQGVNLKGASEAYILSSTDSQTEFIQRRGRILRTDKNKPKSHIIDYVMLPQDIENLGFRFNESEGYVVKRELNRMKSYLDGADNNQKIIKLVKKIEDAYREVLEVFNYEFISK